MPVNWPIPEAMEIGPITGVRAVSLLNPSRAMSELDPVFKIDPSGRADDETYSPNRKAADRGLEDENGDSDESNEDAMDGVIFSRPTSSRISYFV